MNKSILQNGDLLFMSDESELSKAIIETTDRYSHVGIYFDGYIYHASRKRGVAKQILEDYLTEEKRMGVRLSHEDLFRLRQRDYAVGQP